MSRCHEPTNWPDSGKTSITQGEAQKMDVTRQDDLKAHLIATDEHFRQLAGQHSDLDRRVAELEEKHALSEEEQLEEVRLKKQKLRLKDEMAEIMSRYKTQHVA
jgi:uncharacterized protein YdcH (DUF465 family)